MCSVVSKLFATPWTVQPVRVLCPWDFPGKNTGVGCQLLVERMDVLDPGIEPETLVPLALAGGFFTISAT